MTHNSALGLTLVLILAMVSGPKAWAGKDKGTCMVSLMNPEVAKNEFHQMATKFLAAVRERDLGTFEQFFREDLEFAAILPGGKIINDVPTFMASQKPWFNGNTGSFDFSIQRTEVSADLGSAHVMADYRNVDASGKPFELEIYISFVFRKVDKKWFLVHDQNTVLREVK